MATGVLSDVFLPLAIVLIMIAMGMTLTAEDFRRLKQQKAAVLTGLTSQLLLLPLLGFAVAWLFGLSTVFALGMVLLVASPGGSTSNLIVHVSNADRALSLTLTALSNVAVFVSMPLLLSLGQRAFGSLDGDAAVPVGDLVVQIAALTVVPIVIGMSIARRAPDFAARLEEPAKRVATIVFLVIVTLLVIQNWSAITSDAPEFGPAFVTLNLLALAAGTLLAFGVGLPPREATTIGIETGIQNSTLSIAIALSVFDSDELAIVPGLYGLWMLFTGFAFAFFMRSRFNTASSSIPVGSSA